MFRQRCCDEDVFSTAICRRKNKREVSESRSIAFSPQVSLRPLDSETVGVLPFPKTRRVLIIVAYVIAMLVDNIIDLHIIMSSIGE